MKIKSEPKTPYGPKTRTPDPEETAILQRAQAILDGRMRASSEAFTSPDTARQFLRLKLHGLAREVFGVLWLDNKHRMIEAEELFHGTLDASEVHPREVVKAALHHNAAACILYHNHPSGDPEPSDADRRITLRLKDVLGLVGVRVLDHMIVGETVFSFTEQGW